VPVLAIFTGAISKEQYDTLRREVNWEGNIPKGVMVHAVGFDPAGGIHVADVWESAELLNEFVGSRLMPTFQKHGLQPPNVEVYPTHNVNSYSGIDAYKVKG